MYFYLPAVLRLNDFWFKFDEEFQRAGAANDTHTSTLTGSNQARSSLRQSSNGNKLIDEALKKTDAYLNFEKKMDLAKKRRERLHALKSADSRTANNRRDNCSRRSLQKKWIEDRTREKKSFLLRRSTEDHVVMRKIYKTALQKLMTWQLEDAREVRKYCMCPMSTVVVINSFLVLLRVEPLRFKIHDEV